MKPADLAHQRQAIPHPDWLDQQNTTKSCATCRKILPLEAFGTRAGASPTGYRAKGRMSTCRACDAARKRKPA